MNKPLKSATGEIAEAFEQAHLLIQEAKGMADNIDHLDFAEHWINKAEDLARDLQDKLFALDLKYDARVSGLIHANSDNVIRRRGLAKILRDIRPALSDEGRKRVDAALEEHRGR